VLHSLEIVAARPGPPGGHSAVPYVPPAEGSAGNRRRLPSHGHRVVGGRGPKVIAQATQWHVRVRPRVHEDRRTPHHQGEPQRVRMRVPTVENAMRATV